VKKWNKANAEFRIRNERETLPQSRKAAKEEQSKANQSICRPCLSVATFLHDRGLSCKLWEMIHPNLWTWFASNVWLKQANGFCLPAREKL